MDESCLTMLRGSRVCKQELLEALHTANTLLEEPEGTSRLQEALHTVFCRRQF